MARYLCCSEELIYLFEQSHYCYQQSLTLTLLDFCTFKSVILKFPRKWLFGSSSHLWERQDQHFDFFCCKTEPNFWGPCVLRHLDVLIVNLLQNHSFQNQTRWKQSTSERKMNDIIYTYLSLFCRRRAIDL